MSLWTGGMGVLRIIYLEPAAAANPKSATPPTPGAGGNPAGAAPANAKPVDRGARCSYYVGGGNIMGDESTKQELPAELENKVIIMNGFTQQEIVAIMRAVRRLFENPGDLIFAKTTPKSVNMVLKDLIVDMSEDHEYLKNNPPEQLQKQQGRPKGDSEGSGSSGGGGESPRGGAGSGGPERGGGT